MTSPLFEIPLRGLLMCGGVAWAVALVLAIPLIQYYLLHPDEFSSHTIAVFAFSPDAMQRLFGLHPELPHNVWGVVQFQFEKTIGMFTAQGSTDVWFNMPGRPLLDGISSVFLVIGLLACLWSWRRPLSTLLLTWVVMVYVFGAFLAIDPPSAHKPIPISPALCLVIALGLETALLLLTQLLSLPRALRSGHVRWRQGLAAHRSRTALERGVLRDPEGLRTRTWQRPRTVDLVTRGLLVATVAVIGFVNIQREIAYETSPGYQSFMSNPGLAWGRYLGRLGTPAATVVSPLGYSGEFPLLFAPQVTICTGEWAGHWQRCPPTRVVIFDLGADADAARYSAIVHRPTHPGPTPFGQRQFWSVTSPGMTPLPDPAVALGHSPRSS